jgi:membrane-bound lytic murein transglycosylase D
VRRTDSSSLEVPSGRFLSAGAGLLILCALWGCGGAPAPTADVARSEERPADGRVTDDSTTPGSGGSAMPDQGAPAGAAAPRTFTPYDPGFPRESEILNAWEQVYYGNLDLVGAESDSVIFLRLQALLTHLDPGMFEPGAGTLRRRAEELRGDIARSRDEAWLRWQVDIAPPPQPTLAPEADVAGIDISEHSRVTQWVDYFTGRGRERFSTWLWRSGTYRPLMESILREEGVPSDLIAVVFIESGFSLTARSRARAVGPWQFIKATGQRYGLAINNHRDERQDFALATRAAARYLRDLYDMFGDWNLALASYNCGEGRVLRQTARQKTNDYWSLDLPRETEGYVPQFHAALTILRDPAAYGFTTETSPPLDFVEAPLPGPVRLEELARHAGTSLEELKSLNPSWIRKVTPADGRPVMARLPRALGATIELASLPLAPASELKATGGGHRVRRGETLSGIARKYGVSVSALRRENGLGTKSLIRAGQTLRLPDGAGGDDTEFASNSAKSASKSSKKSSVHVVKRGETLSTIGARYGVRVSDLKRWNKLGGTLIRAGQRLRLNG